MEPRYLVPSANYMSFLRLTRSLRDIQFRCHGATMREIAFAMEINVTTVEKHLRGARDVLQADTTAQAAAKALVLNQIFI
jgi:LuxR family transcriptional regulator